KDGAKAAKDGAKAAGDAAKDAAKEGAYKTGDAAGKAADAAKAVIDWSPAGGVHLITDQGVDKNYRYVWEIHDNAEIILANKQANQFTRGKVTRPIRYWLAKAVGGQKGIQPTQNFVENYEKKDGTMMDWPDADDNLSERYAELDPRFQQTIGYNGMYWNQKRGNLAMYLGPGQKGAHSKPNKTGYFVKKWIPDVVNRHQDKYNFDIIRYRLAEFYLNYAEALNEAQGPVAEAYDAINTIRERSGMPAFPSGLSQEEFRERVRRERTVELAFEDHRWWDIRRWRTAEDVLNKPFTGLKIYKNQPETDPLTFRYKKYVFEKRVFKPEFYHDFYPTSELNLGYLVQNPGW
ncbi:MAG: RagB/SusD family nutrient uptake outer membrane protein, partial [Draconibacterium sp.]|nr:RagB/SusD family nutrient uptake outer membrane protein [Draconibacterium sp.]